MRGQNSLTITGFSTALFSTWYLIDELAVLFDCGDGASSGLLQKSRKAKHVFVSHADRDHVSGLLQFNQLNAREGLSIYYPESSGSFPALAEFTSKFDPHSSGTQWIPVKAGDQIQLRDDVIVRAVENNHVRTEEGQTKSLSYFVDAISRKLKPEFHGLLGSEIGRLRKEQGEEAITDVYRRNVLTYSGDTPIESDGRYANCEVLIHEATFLTSAEIEPDNPKRNKHSSLDQVIAMVRDSNVKQLVLGHFSSRYSEEQINAAILHECQSNNLKIPVYHVLPGKMKRDILSAPIFNPA